MRKTSLESESTRAFAQARKKPNDTNWSTNREHWENTWRDHMARYSSGGNAAYVHKHMARMGRRNMIKHACGRKQKTTQRRTTTKAWTYSNRLNARTRTQITNAQKEKPDPQVHGIIGNWKERSRKRETPPKTTNGPNLWGELGYSQRGDG